MTEVLAGRTRSPGQSVREPRIVERRAKTRRSAYGGGPECLGLDRFISDGQAADLQQRRGKRLEGLGARIINASLPVLDRARAHTHSRRELALR